MVEVYFEELNYEQFTETEAYGVPNLIADFGGQLGLWLGVSVVTIAEVLVFLYDLLTLCFHNERDRRKKMMITQRRGSRGLPISNGLSRTPRIESMDDVLKPMTQSSSGYDSLNINNSKKSNISLTNCA